MKMKCPHCGLTGKAEDRLFGKKIRCPQCKEIFKVTEEVANAVQQTTLPQKDHPDPQPDANTKDTTPPGEAISDEEILLSDQEDNNTEEAENELAEGVLACSKCGFVFSQKFTVEQDSNVLCAICTV